MSTAELLAVVAGAGIGGGLRYWVGTLMIERFGSSFPWHTFAINISGAFALGLLIAVTGGHAGATTTTRLFLGVGVLGGFTTFSTLSYESVALIDRGLWAQGAANMFGSGAAGIVAAFAGLALGHLISARVG